MLNELHCFEGYTKAPEPASSPLLWKNFPCYGSFLPQIFPEKRLGFWLSDTPQRNLPPWSILVFFLHWSAFSFSPLGFLFSGLRLGPNTHRSPDTLVPNSVSTLSRWLEAVQVQLLPVWPIQLFLPLENLGGESGQMQRGAGRPGGDRKPGGAGKTRLTWLLQRSPKINKTP